MEPMSLGSFLKTYWAPIVVIGSAVAFVSVLASLALVKNEERPVCGKCWQEMADQANTNVLIVHVGGEKWVYERVEKVK